MTNINITDDPADSSPLHYAAANNDLDTINALALEADFSVNLPGVLDMSPLMAALIHKKDTAALRLIELGANVNQVSIIGSSPLMSAGLLGATNMVQALLDSGALVDYQLITEGQTNGWTALSICTLQGQTAVVKLLLDNGADASISNAAGQSPLEVAQVKGHADIVALLIEKNIQHGEAQGWATASEDVTGSPEESETWSAEQIAGVEAALAGHTAEQRTQMLIMGIVEAGNSFVIALEQAAESSPEGSLLRAHCLEAKIVFARWLSGERFTERADEAERRVLTLQSVLSSAGDRVADLMPTMARAIMQLPEGHPKRKDRFALETLISYVEFSADVEQTGSAVLAITEIVEMGGALVASIDPDKILALVELAEEKIPAVKAGEVIHREQLHAANSLQNKSDAELTSAAHLSLRKQLRTNASNFFLAHALYAKESEDLVTQQVSSKRAFEQLKLLDELGTEALSVDRYFLEGALREMNGDIDAAADAYALATNQTGGDSLFSRQHEGRLRLRLEQYSRAVVVLEPAVPQAQSLYLGALENSSVATTASTFNTVSTMLAFAYALDEKWEHALRALDQSKSLRLRHRSAMRASVVGRRILELEAALYNIDRGIEPPAGARPPPGPIDMQHDNVLRRTLYLEEYRKVRPEIPDNLVESPSIATLAGSTNPGEGVLVIGISFLGTILALVTAEDTARPSRARVISDLTNSRLFDVCANWRQVLVAPEGYKENTYEQALDELIPGLDEALGEPIRELVENLALSQLTIIPHLWLHAAPFWALPSLAALSIAVAPSAGQLVAARNKSSIERHATVVGDPTLDLPLSRVEAHFVSDHLSTLGFSTSVVVGREAIQDNVVEPLSHAGWLHFCGHGRSDMLTPSRAALLLQPGFLAPNEDPIESALEVAQEWGHSPKDGRYATLPTGGRLYEIKYPDVNAREYFLESGNRETLWARYVNDDVTMLAELWRAGDITAAGQFKQCRLVFLSACDVGGGCLGSIYQQSTDEYVGIPGALQLADVACTVASLWPVGEDLAMVYVELFYSEMMHDKEGIDVALLIKRIANRVRKLSGQDAHKILMEQSTQTNDLVLKFRLEAVAHRIASVELPFAHPIHWAAFFVTGASRFSW